MTPPIQSKTKVTKLFQSGTKKYVKNNNSDTSHTQKISEVFTLRLEACANRYGSAKPHCNLAIWKDEDIPTTCNCNVNIKNDFIVLNSI